MADSIQNRNWGILLSALISVLLVSGAYYLAKNGSGPNVAQASTETELLKQIATKDSDGDGLPDWEEALYGTDPHNPDTFHLGMTDGEAVAKGLIVPKAQNNLPSASTTPSNTLSSSGTPAGAAEGTLTDTFARQFFTLYVAAKANNGGNNLSSDQVSALASQALTQLQQTISPTPDFKTASDLTVSGSGPDALRAFAASAEKVIATNSTADTESELQYLGDVVQKNNTSALTRIQVLSSSYHNTAAGLAALPVPTELASADLALINAFARIGNEASDFARVNTDPLTTMLALEQYVQTVPKMTGAFHSLNTVYAQENVTFKATDPGAGFAGILSRVGGGQATSTP